METTAQGPNQNVWPADDRPSNLTLDTPGPDISIYPTGASDRVKPLVERLSSSAHAAVDKATAAAGPAVDWLGRQGSKARAQQQRAADATCAYVSKNPLKSVGICFGTGVVLGMLVRRKW
jgi:ElaB/YqjD/DUF883 family membrane-anchored ribosome-binding protein